jgi:hypothetical protein
MFSLSLCHIERDGKVADSFIREEMNKSTPPEMSPNGRTVELLKFHAEELSYPRNPIRIPVFIRYVS